VNDIVHVALAPPDLVDASLVKKVATIINKDLYGTRLLLARKIPTIIANYHTIREAEIITQSLRTLGLVVITCKGSQLHQPPSVSFRAHTLKLQKGEVVFWDAAGETTRIKAESVFLILKGTRQTYTEKESVDTKMKFNLSATLLTGGIPIWHRVKEKTRNTSIQTEYFVRIYDQISPEPSIEILQHSFDYSFLGAKMLHSSLANLNTFTTELKNAFPQAVFDDKLTLPSVTSGTNIEVSCKLIYLYYQALSKLGNEHKTN
jgi:hypothetical protein